MTNLTATPGLDAVPQLETTTPARGGPGGPMNAQAQALLNILAAWANSANVAHGDALLPVVLEIPGAVPCTQHDVNAEVVSVLRFGADPTGVIDSTPAFQAALNAAKGANGTGVGRSLFRLHVPNPPAGGFYKLTDSIVIDGTHGLHMFGDCSLAQRESGKPEGVLRWYGAISKPIIQIKGGTGVPSNPNFQIKISDLSMAGHPAFVGPGSVPSNLALSGIHLGNISGQNDNTLNRHVVLENLYITGCRFGVWSGNPDGLNTDHASVYLNHCFLYRNAQAGLCWGSGNALLHSFGLHAIENGWGAASFPADSYDAAQVGANVYVASGFVDLFSLATAGSDAYAPTSADVYQGSGRCSITNAWSDTQGYFYHQAGASTNGTASGYHAGMITGVRHYNSSFTLGNTPNSLRITVPGTVVAACLLYGNVEVESGLGGRPVFSGINFARSGATFVGSGVHTQRSLTHLGHGSGNSAQLLMGGADSGVALAHKGNKVPNVLLMGGAAASQSAIQYLGPAASSSGWQIQGEETTGQFRLLANGYFSGADAATPLNVNRAMVYVQIGSGTHAMRVWTYDPNGSAAEVALSAFTAQGGLLSAASGGLRSEVTWQAPSRAAAPTFTSGDYWEGSVFYNSTAKKLQLNTGGASWVDLN